MIELVRDLAGALDGIGIKRMFGGHGLFRDGRMFAIVIRDGLFFKADAATIADFQALGLEPFAYDTRDGRRVLTSYYRAPEAVFDDPAVFEEWARAATGAAGRAAQKTARKRKSTRD